jgi:hypothetical protein
VTPEEARLSDEWARLFTAFRYKATQPRDKGGQWTHGGGGGGAAGPDLAKPGTPEHAAETNMQGVLDRSKSGGHFEQDRKWYDTAHDVVGQRAQAAGIEPATFAGMVAATSPRALWQSSTGRYVNIEFAEKAARFAKANPGKAGREVADATDAPGMLRQSLASAIDIHNGKPVEQVLKGPKIRSFYNNLVDPKGSEHVTIDTHMARAMAGDHKLDDKAVGKYTQGKNYKWASDRVRAVAKANKIPPAQAQAAIWEQWRREG